MNVINLTLLKKKKSSNSKEAQELFRKQQLLLSLDRFPSENKQFFFKDDFLKIYEVKKRKVNKIEAPAPNMPSMTWQKFLRQDAIYHHDKDPFIVLNYDPHRDGTYGIYRAISKGRTCAVQFHVERVGPDRYRKIYGPVFLHVTDPEMVVIKEYGNILMAKGLAKSKDQKYVYFDIIFDNLESCVHIQKSIEKLN